MHPDSLAIGARWLSESEASGSGAAVGWFYGGVGGAVAEPDPEAEWAKLVELRASQTSAGLAEGDGDGPATDRLRAALLRGGIPDVLRVRAWLTFSGAAERIAQHPHAYAQLHPRIAIAAAASDEHARAVQTQIEKDLTRTTVRTAAAAPDSGVLHCRV